ncbi:LuxR family two component transcriptional regulator [Alkalibaculum bacchi]|uniref:Stage 0 sporulation protein A homolog n=1 Tax=Alkalibaculum bacchi TaxID=645887 RepID=A0A366HWX8_9FIRM|nr:response regulator transcription factor [Alkalibaculum bacchi]RBP57939.1 LuxR family two component transcriptional regulator [Alkalibaculum bacchi]
MKVLVIDDDQIVCSSLKMIINQDPSIDVIATANDGNEAIDLYFTYLPDVLLMDIRMNQMSGIDAGEYILLKEPRAKILFLTTFLDDEYIIKALNMGAKGYLVKQDFESIIPSIKAVYAGQNVFGNEIITKLPHLIHYEEKDIYSNLDITEKEFNIITYISEGFSNKEIADTLYLSEGTVRNYISIILEKLQLRDRTQIAVDYYKRKHR